MAGISKGFDYNSFSKMLKSSKITSEASKIGVSEEVCNALFAWRCVELSDSIIGRAQIKDAALKSLPEMLQGKFGELVRSRGLEAVTPILEEFGVKLSKFQNLFNMEANSRIGKSCDTPEMVQNSVLDLVRNRLRDQKRLQEIELRIHFPPHEKFTP